MNDYPFLFYGYGFADPSKEMFVEIHFAEFVDFVDRPALAAPVELAIHAAFDDELPCRIECAKWLWAADWALLRFTQTDPSVSNDDYPLSIHVASLIEAVHGHAPLLEAVSLNAPADWEWNWHDESVAQSPMPSEAPTWKNRFGITLPNGVYTARLRYDIDAMFDEDFETARRKLRRGYDDI